MCQRLCQEAIAESLRLNLQDCISDSIDERIMPAPLMQHENIEIDLEENDELVQPFLLRKASPSRYNFLPGRQ